MVVNNRLGYLFVFLGMSMALYAQRKTEVIRYGDLDQWVVRKITESAIIGKETKTLYCVGPTDTIIGNRPFESKASPWGSSNVMARVSGITKASVSVYPERRDEGYCARLETGIESISAMGIMNVKVLVGGCLYKTGYCPADPGYCRKMLFPLLAWTSYVLRALHSFLPDSQTDL